MHYSGTSYNLPIFHLGTDHGLSSSRVERLLAAKGAGILGNFGDGRNGDFSTIITFSTSCGAAFIFPRAGGNNATGGDHNGRPKGKGWSMPSPLIRYRSIFLFGGAIFAVSLIITLQRKCPRYFLLPVARPVFCSSAGSGGV